MSENVQYVQLITVHYMYNFGWLPWFKRLLNILKIV